MKIGSKIYSIIILFALFGCDKKVNDVYVDIDEIFLLTNNTQKAWDIQSFNINNIEYVDTLKSDTCYQPIWFVSDDNYTLYGYYNSIYCIIHGDWFLEDNNETISFNFDNTGYIGIGPWSGGKYTKWHINYISDDILLVETEYLSDNYLIQFKAI